MRFSVPSAPAAVSKLAAVAFDTGRGSVEFAPASPPLNVTIAALAGLPTPNAKMLAAVKTVANENFMMTPYNCIRLLGAPLTIIINVR
jgi:hypothetical protein